MKIDDFDFTENGDECIDKCQWDQNTNSSIHFMKCKDVYDTLTPCTPFKSKINEKFCQNHDF